MDTCEAGTRYVRIFDIEIPCTATATGELMFEVLTEPKSVEVIKVCDEHHELILANDPSNQQEVGQC